MGPTATAIPLIGHSGPDAMSIGNARGTVKPWQRLAAATWDSQFLRVQRGVYRAAPRLAAHLDELARRRDEGRRMRS